MNAAEFWSELFSQEAQRKARENLTREVKVRPQFKVAANDEPEPTRAPRTILRARDLNDAEQES